MIGTALNVGTVVAGAVVGRLIGARLPEPVRESVMHVIGLMTILIGLLQAIGTKNPLVVLGALVLGAVTGELLRIEERIDRFGLLAQRRFAPGEAESGGNFARGFVVTSILFCVGPMTILGCLDDGLRGDYKLLALKSTLDGISSIAFASALGWGVLLSAVTVLVVQGALTLGAGALAPFMQDAAMVGEVSAVGGVMMLALGLRLLELKPIRVANLLPALAFTPFLVALARLLPLPQ